MQIKNEVLKLKQNSTLTVDSIEYEIRSKYGEPIRWAIVETTETEIIINVTIQD